MGMGQKQEILKVTVIYGKSRIIPVILFTMYPTMNFVSYNGMLIFKKNIHNIPGYCVRILLAEIRRKIQEKAI